MKKCEFGISEKKNQNISIYGIYAFGSYALSKVTCIALKVYIWSVHAFPGNRTHNLVSHP